MAKKLREKYNILKNKYILKRNIFYAGFRTIKSLNEDSDANHTIEIEKATPGHKKRKRSGTRSKSRNSKRLTLECPVYNMRGHNLPNC